MIGRRVLGFVAGLLAWLWLRTLRLTVVLDPALDLEDRRPWVLAFWHGQQFALLRWPRRRPTVVMVSLSRDGALQAAALPRVGLTVARGSSSRGGANGMRAIVRRLRRSPPADAAFAVDGPRGPLGTVHPGAAAVARAVDGVVVPMGCASARARVLRRTWDRYELPWPFSRVVVALGAPIGAADATAVSIARGIDAARDQARAASDSAILSPPPARIRASVERW